MNAPSSTASLAPDPALDRDLTHPLDHALAVLDDPVEQARFTRFSTLAGGQRVADSTLRIIGMHCAACAGIIEQAILSLGLGQFEVGSHRHGRAGLPGRGGDLRGQQWRDL